MYGGGRGRNPKIDPLNIFIGFRFRVKADFISANAIVSKMPQEAVVHIAPVVTASCDMMSFCGAAASCAMKLL